MRVFLLLFTVAAVMLSACKKDEEKPSEPIEITVYCDDSEIIISLLSNDVGLTRYLEKGEHYTFNAMTDDVLQVKLHNTAQSEGPVFINGYRVIANPSTYVEFPFSSIENK